MHTSRYGSPLAARYVPNFYEFTWGEHRIFATSYLSSYSQYMVELPPEALLESSCTVSLGTLRILPCCPSVLHEDFRLRARIIVEFPKGPLSFHYCVHTFHYQLCPANPIKIV